jgi:hypothetical protein
MTRIETFANLSPLPAQEPSHGQELSAGQWLMVRGGVASANEERAV